MELETILNHLGQFGPFQIYVYAVSLATPFFCGLLSLSNVFVLGIPRHRCCIDQCDDATCDYFSSNFSSFSNFTTPRTKGSCGQFRYVGNVSSNATECSADFFSRENIGCTKYAYEVADFNSTAVTDFDLVCDREWLTNFSTSIFMVGILIGSMTVGVMSDKFGRKSVFYWAPITCFISVLAMSFAPTIYVYAFLSMIAAAMSVGMYQVGFVTAAELIGPKWRVWTGNFYQVAFACGELLLCVIAFYIRDWRRLEFVFALLCSLLIILPFILPESIRWQTSRGRSKAAMETLQRAAKWNKVTLPREMFLSDNSMEASRDCETKKYNALDLLRVSATLRRWSINLFCNWAINALVYYGLSLQAAQLGVSTYYTFALLSAVEIPFIIAGTFAMQRYGRRKVLCFVMVAGGISCVIPSFLPAHAKGASVYLAVVGKGCIAMSFALIYVYSIEIFPTVLRSNGLGACSMFSRVGAIIAPFVGNLSTFGDSMPLLLCGIFTIIGGVTALDLPETHGRDLPETFDDVERLKRNQTSFLSLFRRRRSDSRVLLADQ